MILKLTTIDKKLFNKNCLALNYIQMTMHCTGTVETFSDVSDELRHPKVRHKNALFCNLLRLSFLRSAASLKVFNSVVLDDPRKTVYKKVNRGSRETYPSQVYFG
jgi:hypothetical protein